MEIEDKNNEADRLLPLEATDDSPLRKWSKQEIISFSIFGAVILSAILGLIFGAVFSYSKIDYIIENAVVYNMKDFNNTYCCFAVKG